MGCGMMKRRDAMEKEINRIGAGTLCSGSNQGEQQRAAIEWGIRDQPQDRLQMDQTPPGTGAGRFARSSAHRVAQWEPKGILLEESCAAGAQGASALGRQEAALSAQE